MTYLSTKRRPLIVLNSVLSIAVLLSSETYKENLTLGFDQTMCANVDCSEFCYLRLEIIFPCHYLHLKNNPSHGNFCLKSTSYLLVERSFKKNSKMPTIFWLHATFQVISVLYCHHLLFFSIYGYWNCMYILNILKILSVTLLQRIV